MTQKSVKICEWPTCLQKINENLVHLPLRPTSAGKRAKTAITRLSRLEIGLELEVSQNEYSKFIKKFKAHKDKKTTVVPVLARKMTVTSQQSIEPTELSSAQTGTLSLCAQHQEIEAYLRNVNGVVLVTPPPNNHYFKVLKRLQIGESPVENEFKNTLIGQDQTI